MSDTLAIRPVWQRGSHTAPPELKACEVHLWCIALNVPESIQRQALPWLSDIQRDKYERRSSLALKQAYLGGRYYLLSLLGGYNKIAPQDVLLSYSRLNKPYLSVPGALGEAAAELHFNFTDTLVNGTPFGLYAFSRTGDIGVDIEALSRRSKFKPIVEKRFSTAERALVTRADGEIDPETFLHLWTRKEASGKASGQGINFTMRERDLVDGWRSNLNFFDENNRPWQLFQIRFNNDWVGCVVHAGHDPIDLKPLLIDTELINQT